VPIVIDVLHGVFHTPMSDSAFDSSEYQEAK